MPDPHPEQYHENLSLSELVCDTTLSETLGLECLTANSHVEDTSTTTASTDILFPGPSHLPSNVVTNAPGINTPDHEGELYYISKYLIQYVPVKKRPKTSKRATGTRVLSAMNVQRGFLNRKKRKEKEEKEARKAE